MRDSHAAEGCCFLSNSSGGDLLGARCACRILRCKAFISSCGIGLCCSARIVATPDLEFTDFAPGPAAAGDLMTPSHAIFQEMGRGDTDRRSALDAKRPGEAAQESVCSSLPTRPLVSRCLCSTRLQLLHLCGRLHGLPTVLRCATLLFFFVSSGRISSWLLPRKRNPTNHYLLGYLANNFPDRERAHSSPPGLECLGDYTFQHQRRQ